MPHLPLMWNPKRENRITCISTNKHLWKKATSVLNTSNKSKRKEGKKDIKKLAVNFHM